MKKPLALVLLVLLPLLAWAEDKGQNQKETDRVKEAGEVLKEIIGIPDNIPKDLVDKAECVIVLPSVKKAAFGVGISYGRGVMTCRSGRHYTGPWTAPAMYALEGGNIGLQLGGQATDFVLLVMNPRGADSLLSSKVKLGADAAAAAGLAALAYELLDAHADTAQLADGLEYDRSWAAHVDYLRGLQRKGREMLARTAAEELSSCRWDDLGSLDVR